jgi:MFS family permease
MTSVLSQSQTRLYTPSTITLAIIVTISYTGLGFVSPLRSLYASQMGASSIEIGLMTIAFLVANFLTAPFVGRLTDRFQPGRVLWIGLLAHALIVLAYLPVQAAAWLIMLRALEGMATASILPPARALMNKLAPPGRQGEAMGLVGASQSAGILLGPVAGTLLASFLGYAPSFLAASALLALVALLAFFLLSHQKNVTVAQKQELLSGRAISPSLLPIYALGVQRMLVPGVMLTIWSLFMHERGASLFLIGLSYATYGIASFLFAPLAGKWSDRVGRYSMILLGLTMAGIIYTSYALVTSVFWIVALGVIEGIGIAIEDGALNGLVSDMIEPGMQGRIQANFTAANTIGQLLGATIAGALYSIAPGLPFLITGPLYLVVAALLLTPPAARFMLSRQNRSLAPLPAK